MEKDYKDFWDKHNLGTRIALMSFILLYFIVIIYALIHGISVENTVFVSMINNISYIAFLAFSVVTLGVNGMRVIFDGLAKLKK